jgi:lipopolysaccharide transport system permease protein
VPTYSATGQFVSLRGLADLLTRHRHLTWALAKREIMDRYAGQMLGLVWAVGHPMLLMAVYVFVFGVVFRVRMGDSFDLPLDYTVYVLAGLIPWLAVSESLGKGSGIISGNSNLVKQVVFPLDVLPVKAVLAAFFPQVLCLSLLTLYVLFTTGAVPWTYALLPLLLLVQFFFIAGLTFFLAAIGPFFRDLKDFVQIFCTIGIYIMPVVYLPSMVPAAFHPFLYANPFSYLIWCYQDACYFGRFEHPWAWAVLLILATTMFSLGYRLFLKLKPYFGNVL